MNIHASCISLDGRGILFLGDSGAGKSDLSLRMITSFGAKLVADDRVDIKITDNKVIASAPDILKGLLEVRGIGIISLPLQDSVEVNLVVNLTTAQLERLPEKSFYEIAGVRLPQISLNPFETSASAKVLAAISLL